MTTLQEKIQKPSVGNFIELYHIDMTALSTEGGHFFFTPSLKQSDMQPPIWRGQQYTPFPVEGEGFETNAKGQFPRPKLRISNVLRLAEGVVTELNELIGATVTRWRVFEENLDNGTDPDSNAHFPPEIFKIDRRSGHNALWIEFELASFIDQEGKELPGRQVLTVCSHTYRVYDADLGDFNYKNVTCPYIGTQYFDINGSAVSKQNDVCSHKFGSGCRLRFGREPLPFRGFLGVKKQGEQ